MGIVLVNSVFMYEKGRWTYLFFQIIIVLYFYDYKYRVIPKQILSFTLLVQNQFSDHFLRIFADFGSYLLNIFSQKILFLNSNLSIVVQGVVAMYGSFQLSPTSSYSAAGIRVFCKSYMWKNIHQKRVNLNILRYCKTDEKNEKLFMLYINKSRYHNTTHADNHVKKNRHQIRKK